MSNRPTPDEYVPYQYNYIKLVNDEPILDVLENLKESTYSFFSDIDPDKGDHAYTEGKWTLKEVVGHMIDAERTFAYRVLAFSRGTTELPGFDQDEYVIKGDFGSQFFKDLVNEFRLLREANLFLFKALSADQLLIMAKASGNPISVRALLYIAAGHEMHHLNIISEKYL